MKSYIVVKTYVKIGDEFIDFFKFNGPVGDPDYIDGALELSINGVSLIDKSMYDYIDDLWSYLAEGLSKVYRGQPFKTYFPDQPIEINLIPKGNDILISVECNEEVKVYVNKEDFLMVMAEHARKFFEHLKEIVPSADEACNVSCKLLEQI